jgi:hypothetical protein
MQWHELDAVWHAKVRLPLSAGAIVRPSSRVSTVLGSNVTGRLSANIRVTTRNTSVDEDRPGVLFQLSLDKRFK